MQYTFPGKKGQKGLFKFLLIDRFVCRGKRTIEGINPEFAVAIYYGL